MKGLIGAATVMGSLMYGAGHCWHGTIKMHLRGSSLEDCPGDNQFISSLDHTDVPGGTTGEDLAEGASFWHAFLTPFWGPETIVIFKRNYVEAMCGLSQIQDKPSKSFDQNQPDITFGKRSSPKHKRP